MAESSSSHAAIAHAAAMWHARLARIPGEAPPPAFERWHGADRAHAEAFARVAAAQECARAAAAHPDLLALRQETIARLAVHQARGTERRRRTGAALAALALVLGPLAGWYAAEHHAAPPAAAETMAGDSVYRTGTGQRLAVMLPDGSRMTLNTASRVRVAYTPGERHILLEQGQAWFEVAKGQPRPFRVTAGDRDVVAHGTAFDVRLDRAGTTVVLIEGKVTVGQAGEGDRDPHAVAMLPDDMLVAHGDQVALSRRGDARQIEAWRDGMVVFADAPLAQAAAELNRYSDRPLVVKDARAAAIHVSGAFRTGESTAFAEAVALAFPVRVIDRKDGAIELVSR